jgi:hypothetical protein
MTTMTAYYVMSSKTMNANTAEYGFGDAPKTVYFVSVAVEADTVRRAMNLAKKRRPNLCFSGINADSIYTEEQMLERGYKRQVEFAKDIYLWRPQPAAA